MTQMKLCDILVICHKFNTFIDVLLKIGEGVENVSDNSHCDWRVLVFGIRATAAH